MRHWSESKPGNAYWIDKIEIIWEFEQTFNIRNKQQFDQKLIKTLFLTSLSP